MAVRRTYNLTLKTINRQQYDLDFSEKDLLAIQKAINLILNNHGPLASHCEVGGIVASMVEEDV